MSWRKIDVKGARKQATVWEDSKVKRVEWQPGNGSRYQIIVTELSSWLDVPGMLSDGGVLVVEGPTNLVMHAGYFNFDGELVAEYVKEKMAYASIIDASETTKVIGTLLHRPIRVFTDQDGRELPEGFLEFK